MQRRSHFDLQRSGLTALLWGLPIFLVGLGLWIFAPWQRSSNPQPASENAVRGETDLAPEHLSNIAPETSVPETSTAAEIARRFNRNTNTPTAQLIAQLLDTTAPLNARRKAARMLAREGSDDAILALRTALKEGPRYLNAAIAEGLGESTHPQAHEILMSLLRDTDETVVRGALRGVALRGDGEAAEILTNVLFDSQKPESLRTEAALCLGDVNQSAALDALMRAANELTDSTVWESVLEGLGKRPFAETEKFFRASLESSTLSAESKALALGALGNSTGDAAPLLLEYARNSNPEIREAAAWALSASSSPADIAQPLLDLLQHETSPEVRTRLYQALGAQETFDVGAVLSLTQKEVDPAARLAALNLLAEGCRTGATPEALAFFNQTGISELKSIALTNPESHSRLSSVNALRRANTPESINALQQIAQQSTDRSTIDAANSALRSRLHL